MTSLPMRQTLIDILLTLLIILLQTTLVRFLAVGGLEPDIVLVWIVFYALRRGQISGTIAGFASGLLLDLLSGADGMLGLAALSKTVVGFLTGYYFNENKTLQTLGSYRSVLILAGMAFVHNLIYFTIFLQGTDVGVWGTLALYGIPSAAYTAAIGLLPMFAYARRLLS
jgi:rod shape-determining protein MreD